MKIQLAEKLKNLRKEKNISQEKLAEYLNVSFQAVSKWETETAYPDISLLPDIARFFGITVDELLQAEIIDEKKLYDEYEKKAWEIYSNRKDGILELWLEAYRKMPNNVNVKEMLMSTYYDMDKVKYKDEIIALCNEIYSSNAPNYYKGQAIKEAAIIYAVNGNKDMAEKWALKSFQLMHCQEVIMAQIFDGEDLLNQVAFFTYWVLNELFYMACRIDASDNISGGLKYKQDVFKAVVGIYEIIYKNDDMGFDDILKLYDMNEWIARHEIELCGDEEIVKKHLTRAFECVKKSIDIKEHNLKLPLLENWYIPASPLDNMQWVRQMKSDLSDKCFDGYRNFEWFFSIDSELDNLLSKNS